MQDPVDVDPAQAGAEAVVADGQDRRAAAVGQLAEHADGRVQAPDHLAGRVVPLGLVDPGLVDVQVAPDAMLERVEVLELDHQHRPVGDVPVGEQAPLGPAPEALDGQPGVLCQLFERLRGTLPEVAQRVVRGPRP